ncbi:hypothetical protein BC936DRAFT_144179 [Jimgerdemannia flammicorona]|uniref:FCP1 homology domain-containing protein n=1 Tax=Jimgerdemannia flammicorona TaxID=994334 RepID=A0A432ZY84_9FUNG|nr:hypothetical protein BC936DRAFT_144179 [Jimgerdemannia flammicorona]
MVGLFGEYKERLTAVWARDKFGLTDEQYNSDFATIKDLSRIWEDSLFGGRYDQHNTVLLDDSRDKAQLQPWNAVRPSTFGIQDIGGTDNELRRLMTYLKELQQEEDVKAYITQNPFQSRDCGTIPPIHK